MKKMLLLWLLAYLAPNMASQSGKISGYVKDSFADAPLAGAKITLIGTELKAITDANGFFEISKVPPGKYSLEVNLTGYHVFVLKEIPIFAGASISVQIALIPAAVAAAEKEYSQRYDKNRAVYGALKVRAKDDAVKAVEGELRKRDSIHPPAVLDHAREAPKEVLTELKTAPLGGKRDKTAHSGLRAGYADDNKQFNYFIHFLHQYRLSVQHYPLDVDERIRFIAQDAAGKAIANAEVAIYGGGKMLTRGRTYADGSFFFFPSLYDTALTEYTIRYTYQQQQGEMIFSRHGKRVHPLITATARVPAMTIPLDILFILDTTGSMGEEIKRLKTTIDLIHLNLTSLDKTVRVRFGLVLYRDRNDEYVTKIIPLTDDVALFQQELQQVTAEGGGDTPEDLQSALKVAVQEIDWHHQGIRLGFVITDAPPHLDYGQSYTYLDAATEAKEKGIKLFAIGTGGLDLMGEYILRQIAQYTYAKYIFLHYGEKGESEGGVPGSVSHHTGANYQTDKLEALIIQFAKEELAQQTDKPLTPEEDYFTASKTGNENNSNILTDLFRQALSQLLDYSSMKIEPQNVLAVLPLTAKEQASAIDAEYLTEQMALAAKTFTSFTLAERVDLQKLVHELGVQQSGLIDDSLTVKMGKFLGAQLLLSGNLFQRPEEYEAFLKLWRVETGELLAITRLKIDRRLCLN